MWPSSTSGKICRKNLLPVNSDATASGGSRHNLWRELGAVASAFVASRLLVFGTIYLSRLEIIRGPLWRPGSWIDALAHGDGAGYLACATQVRSVGVCYPDPTIAWFPLYSWTVAAVALLLRDPAIAALVVSNVCLFAAGWVLYRMVRREVGDEQVSGAAVMLLMFAPGALFFSTATADSMVLLLAAASLLAARNGRWTGASVYALLAGATTNVGLLLVVPLVTELAMQSRVARGHQRLRWRRVWPLALLPVQLLAALLIGRNGLDDPLALFRLAADAQTTFTRLTEISSTFTSYARFWEWIFVGSVITAGVLCAAAFAMKLRASYAVFATLLLAACIVSHDWESPRTLATAFPLSVTLALVARKLEWTYEAILLVSAGLLALFTILFANGHWLT